MLKHRQGKYIVLESGNELANRLRGVLSGYFLGMLTDRVFVADITYQKDVKQGLLSALFEGPGYQVNVALARRREERERGVKRVVGFTSEFEQRVVHTHAPVRFPLRFQYCWRAQRICSFAFGLCFSYVLLSSRKYSFKGTQLSRLQYHPLVELMTSCKISVPMVETYPGAGLELFVPTGSYLIQ